MAVTLPNLEAYMRALGKGYVFTTDDWETAGTLAALGYTEGDIKVAFNPTHNDLTFPEATGEAVHASQLQGENPVITIPLVIRDKALWEKLSPIGATGGGFSAPQDVDTFGLAIFPESVIKAGLAYGGAAWAPAAPEMAFWGWKVYFRRPELTYKQSEGGKTISTIEAVCMYDSTKPEGMKLYDTGDPVVHGYAALRV